LQDQHYFSTSSTQFAAYIVAANLLQYLCAELRKNSQVMFLFLDPHGHGNDIYHNWHFGVVNLVDPKVLFNARNKLVNEIMHLKKEGKPRIVEVE
jgi:hypothetical protein